MMGDFYSVQFLVLLGAGLVLTGAISGVLAGLLGVGGGIVIVPVLVLLFDFLNMPDQILMHLAVATSLATIIPTSISSARSHHRRGAIDLHVLRNWAPFILLGAACGGILSHYLDSGNLKLIFGIIALAVSLNMVLPRTLVLGASLPDNLSARGGLGGGIGTFSALMGIGGGTLSVPIMSMFSMPVHRAVGTASAFGLVIAVPAVLGFIWSGWGIVDRPPGSLGYVNLPAAILILSASVLTAPVGSRLAHSLNPARLRLAFAVFLFISASRMLWSVIA